MAKSTYKIYSLFGACNPRTIVCDDVSIEEDKVHFENASVVTFWLHTAPGMVIELIPEPEIAHSPANARQI